MQFELKLTFTQKDIFPKSIFFDYVHFQSFPNPRALGDNIDS